MHIFKKTPVYGPAMISECDTLQTGRRELLIGCGWRLPMIPSTGDLTLSNISRVSRDDMGKKTFSCYILLI
ncbi:MAG: hypothetical protein A2017_08695 [Lentisphaerae bacterium GWF2_44_16]|nr:MAG: hypothetical protein A2017_08695 [Lentisphaerae bacterium GWF2_44_16]